MRAVVEICRRLDGLPLAIELAAARLRSMTVQQVADRLGDRFRLLTGGSRTAVARHQTLRAVVAWSWDLLTDEERHLAERLAVFAGGATQESAEDVCAGTGLPVDDVLDLLIALADKSLVQVVAGEPPRYRMLETIREYGVERLTDHGEVTGVRAAHAAHFLRLAETAEPRLRTGEQVEWIERLGRERDNLLAALRFAADVGDADTAVRLAAAMSWYWSLQGSHTEAYAWLDLALSVPGPSPTEARAIVLVVHAVSAFAAGRPEMTMERARRLVDEELAHIDGLTGHPLLALVGPGAAMLADDTAGALASIEHNLAHPDPWARAVLVAMRSAIDENDGDVVALRHDVRDAYERFAEIGDRWGMANTIMGLGGVLLMDGDVPGAIEAFETSMTLLTELRASEDMSQALIRISMARVRLGDVDGARRDVARALEVAEDRRSPEMAGFARHGLGDLARHTGDLDAAQAYYAEALADLDRAAHGPGQIRAVAHSGMALVDIARDRPRPRARAPAHRPRAGRRRPRHADRRAGRRRAVGARARQRRAGARGAAARSGHVAARHRGPQQHRRHPDRLRGRDTAQPTCVRQGVRTWAGHEPRRGAGLPGRSGQAACLRPCGGRRAPPVVRTPRGTAPPSPASRPAARPPPRRSSGRGPPRSGG